MRKRFCIRSLLILLSAGVLGAVALSYRFHLEPVFEGRRLSDWIWIMNTKKPGPEKEQARAVVRQLATNSIPLLLAWLRQEDRPSWIGRFDTLRHRCFFWLLEHTLIANRSITSWRDFNPSHSAMAMWALPELDHKGRTNAIPTLIRMLAEKNPNPDETARAAGAAYIVLSKMAPESIAPLIEALSNPDVQVWSLAAGALGEIGPEAKAAIPILEKRFQDKDPRLRVSAADIVGKLGENPDIFIPVVIQSLREVSWSDLDFSLEILVLHKDYAKGAVPVLVNIFNSTPGITDPTNSIVRNEAMNALRQIDPSAADKLGMN